MNWNDETEAAVLSLARATATAQLRIECDGETLLDYVAHADPVDVYAVQKGLVSILCGIAEDKFLFDVSDNVNHHLAPEWTRLSPWDEAKLTIEILLQMTTGMDDELAPLGVIGETWRYNNVAYNYLKRLLAEQSGLSLPELTRDWLTAPLGMTQTTWQDRPQQLPDGRHLTGLLSTADDLAKLGRAVLDKGGGLVSEHYVERMLAPSSSENPAWGLCWWRNDQSHFRVPMREERVREGRLIPAAPTDLVAARGAGENGLYVVPGERLVVARTAMPRSPNDERSEPFERPFWEAMSVAIG